jgi:hypothetical protein
MEKYLEKYKKEKLFEGNVQDRSFERKRYASMSFLRFTNTENYFKLKHGKRAFMNIHINEFSFCEIPLV